VVHCPNVAPPKPKAITSVCDAVLRSGAAGDVVLCADEMTAMAGPSCQATLSVVILGVTVQARRLALADRDSSLTVEDMVPGRNEVLPIADTPLQTILEVLGLKMSMSSWSITDSCSRFNVVLRHDMTAAMTDTSMHLHVLATGMTTRRFCIYSTSFMKILSTWAACLLALTLPPVSSSAQDGCAVSGRSTKTGPLVLTKHLEVPKRESLSMGSGDDGEG